MLHECLCLKLTSEKPYIGTKWTFYFLPRWINVLIGTTGIFKLLATKEYSTMIELIIVNNPVSEMVSFIE